MTTRRTTACITLALFSAGALLRADVKLPAIFGSHMVLQQGEPIAVWGQADADEAVTVKLGASTAQATADGQGNWRVALPAAAVARDLTMTVTGKNTLTFEDVAVGEVWLCSGQSNMEMGVTMCLDVEKEVAAANDPDLRLIDVPKVTTAAPQKDFTGAWVRCTSETVAKHGTWGGFSACAYYFGRELRRTLNVPVGLIDSSWGGSRIEPWAPPEGFRQITTLSDLSRRVEIGTLGTAAHRKAAGDYLTATAAWIDAAQKALQQETVIGAPPAMPGELAPLAGYGDPTAMYNAMIAPLVPYGIKGAIWYQGESNHGEGMAYVEKTKALVQGWRSVWNKPDLPYYYVQIAPWPYGEEDPTILATFWEAQAAIEKAIPHTGMAVIHDVGDVNDIHPKNKQEVGRRLALLALHDTYGKQDLVCRGPLFRAMTVEPGKLRVTFDQAEGGLKTRDGKAPDRFEIIGENGLFVAADAVIDGAAVVLSAPAVKTPVAMRFAWDKLTSPNLTNQAGLPATACRAGEIPVRADLDAHVPEAKDYALLYSLDLPDITYANDRVVYPIDRRQELAGAFDRVAYFLVVRKGDGKPQFVFVSMAAFSPDLDQLGVPAFGTKARFQQAVSAMQVRSNVAGIVTGDNLAGFIEFWPSNYGPENGTNVEGASASAYDFGDRIADEAPDGYSSMQVHNPAAKQTLFAYNNWKSKGGGDIGIGNAAGPHPDWTFTKSAGSYSSARLQVLVHPTPK
jgi:sialate O-acetylesterase